jgi:hypothetical protein
MFVTAVQGLLVLHSWKEDVAEQQQVRHDRQDPPTVDPSKES